MCLLESTEARLLSSMFHWMLEREKYSLVGMKVKSYWMVKRRKKMMKKRRRVYVCIWLCPQERRKETKNEKRRAGGEEKISSFYSFAVSDIASGASCEWSLSSNITVPLMMKEKGRDVSHAKEREREKRRKEKVKSHRHEALFILFHSYFFLYYEKSKHMRWKSGSGTFHWFQFFFSSSLSYVKTRQEG